MLHALAPLLPAFLIVYTLALLGLGWKWRLFAPGLALIRAHRASWVRHSLLGYGLFALGLGLGLGVPEIARALGETGSRALGQTGIGHLQGLLELTGGILLWNTLVGLLATNLLPGLVAGLPVIVINLGRSFALGLVLAQVSAPKLLAHAPTILIELQGYLLLSWAAWLWVKQTWPGLRGRLRGRVQFADLRDDARSLWETLRQVLPLALLMLLVGAWYEGAELHWLIPLLGH